MDYARPMSSADIFLEEEMAKYIEVEETIKHLAQMQWYDDEGDSIDDYDEKLSYATDWIEGVPTVDVVPTNALRLFIEWARECDFGYDNIPDEYEKYKDDIEDLDLGWTEGLMYIVLKEIEAGVYVPQY